MPTKLIEYTYGPHTYMRIRMPDGIIEEIDVYWLESGPKYKVTSTSEERCQEIIAAFKEQLNAEIARLNRMLNAAKKEREKLSSKIHVESVSIRQHEKTAQNPPDKTNTYVYQMFGKRMVDLTPEEYRAYYNVRQRVNREKRKTRFNTK